MQYEPTSFLRKETGRFPLTHLVPLLFSVACAKVGDPLPPIVQRPPEIQNLQLEQSNGLTRVVFSVPAPNIEWVEVYRHCNPAAPISRFQIVAQIGEDELTAHVAPGLFKFEDRSREGRVACRYAVRFVDRNGQRSEFSNIVLSNP